MFKWKVEDMKLLEIEKTSRGMELLVINTSTEDKIEFVNRMNDNKLDKIFEAERKYREDLESGVIKTDSQGKPKTVSFKPWIKRNGYDDIISDFVYDWGSKLGKITLLRCNRHIWSLDSPCGSDTFVTLVDELFCRQLQFCISEETKYFLNTDEKSVLERKVKDFISTYGTLNFNISWGGSISIVSKETGKSRHATLEDLKFMNEKYCKLEEFISKLDCSIEF